MYGRFAVFTQIRQYSLRRANLPISIANYEGFQQSLNFNDTLKRIHSLYLENKIQAVDGHNHEISTKLNSLRSLPRTSIPKAEIFEKVLLDPKIGAWRKPIMKWIRLGVFLMKYYKNGMQATYATFMDTKPIKKMFEEKANVPMVTQLFKSIEMNEIEFQKNLHSNLVHIPITRNNFVEYHRRNQAWKLPSFFLVAAIFEELTAVICYLFPRVVPYNCLTPGGFKKIAKKNINNTVKFDSSNLKYQSPYTISGDLLHQSLTGRLPQKYISPWQLKVCKLSNNKRIPSESLMYVYQHMFVDDWLYLQHIFNEDITKISYEELVNSILERKLYTREEDLGAMVNTDAGRKVLLWRLFLYWSFRFDGCVSVSQPGKTDGLLFSEKWGINNISIHNFPGTLNGELVSESNLKHFE